MANKERGEVGLDVGGKVYTLRPTFNSVCELETLINKSFDDVMSEIQQNRLSGLRATVWCLLQEHHGAEIRTLKDAADWIEQAGGTTRVLEVLEGALDANTDPEDRANGNPRKAQVGRRARRRGIGGRSSSARA